MQMQRKLQSSLMTVLGLATMVGIASSAIAGGPEAAPAVSGFYITAGIGGAGFQASNSATTLPFDGSNGSVQLLPKNSLNFAWFAGLGYQIDPLLRIDLMYLNLGMPFYGYEVSPTNTAWVNALGVSNLGFADLYLDIMSLFGRNDSEGLFHPYVGAGVGFSNNATYNITSVNAAANTVGISTNSHTDFAWRAIVGLTFPITDHFQAYTQYNFISAGRYSFGNVVKGISTTSIVSPLVAPANFNIYSNLLAAGITYIF